MFFPTIFNAKCLRLIVVLSPKVLVLDPFDYLDLCLWHGQLEISFQSIPLVACLYNVLNHDLVILSCQQLHLVLPIIRQVVGLGSVDNLLNFDLNLLVPESHDLYVIVSFKLQIDVVTIAGVLILDLALYLC